jgi:hypothetical protein
MASVVASVEATGVAAVAGGRREHFTRGASTGAFELPSGGYTRSVAGGAGRGSASTSTRRRLQLRAQVRRRPRRLTTAAIPYSDSSLAAGHR